MTPKRNVFVHLHTLDLRLHDSPSLHLAHDPASNLSSNITHYLPVYIFDSRQLDSSQLSNSSSAPKNQASHPTEKQAKAGTDNPNTSDDIPHNPNVSPQKTRNSPKSRVSGFHRTSPHRLGFLLQAVYGLRDGYRRSGGDMLIGYGKPETLIPRLVKALQDNGDRVTGVWAQKEISVEEQNMLDNLGSLLEASGVKLSLHDSKCLLPEDQLPFKVRDTPDVYTSFRKKVEGLGLEMGEGMMVKPLRTAEWSTKDGKVTEARVSVGKSRAQLKPFPALDLSGIKLSNGGWVTKGDNLESVDKMYAQLAGPILGSPPFGGWSTASKSDHISKPHPKSCIPFTGDEEDALSRLERYVGHAEGDKWVGGAPARTYKHTRNGMVGEGFSTKFAAFLSLGCLSPKEAGWRVGKLLERAGKDKDMWNNVYWIIFELLWRDFFQYTTEKYSSIKRSSLFDPTGYSEQIQTYPANERPKPQDWHYPNWDDPQDPARRWCEGRTGVPFIDANMRELRETGYMSNRGRQNVASFLVKDLYVDWRVGAEFFEMHLVDYDTCSNWGNWQYQAGVGNDPRSSRQFNPIKQASDYDPNNEYIKLWIPELANIPDDYAQTPWLLGNSGQLNGYPSRPILESPQWKKHYKSHGGGRRGHGSHGQPHGGGTHTGGRGGQRGGVGGGRGGRGGGGGGHHGA